MSNELYIGAIDLSPWIVTWQRQKIHLVSVPIATIASIKPLLEYRGATVYMRHSKTVRYGQILFSGALRRDEYGTYVVLSLSTLEEVIHYRLRLFTTIGRKKWINHELGGLPYA